MEKKGRLCVFAAAAAVLLGGGGQSVLPQCRTTHDDGGYREATRTARSHRSRIETRHMREPPT